MSKADGSIVFKAEIDDKKAQKELDNLKRDIDKLDSELNAKQSEKSGIASKLNAAKQAAETAKRAIEALRKESERLNDSQWIAAQGFTPADYQSNVVDRREIVSKELEKQEQILKGQSKEASTLERSYKRVEKECGSIANRLEKAEDKAGELVQKAQKANAPIAKIEQRFSKITDHLKQASKRLFTVAALTAILSRLNDEIKSVIYQSNETTRAIARLKGALLTLAAPLVQVVLPAIAQLLNLITALVTEIITLVSILSGKSEKELKTSGKQLYNEATALGAVGEAAKDAGKHLANFDEINQLSGSGSGASGGVAAIAPDFDFDLNPALEKLSGLTDKIHEVFRTIRAGLDIVIDDLKWSFDKKVLPKSKATWLSTLTALLGMTIGGAFGGFGGAVIGLSLGALIGLYISGFDAEYMNNEMSAKEAWTVVIAGLIGALLGGVFGGFIGAVLGFSLGAIIGLYLVKFTEEEQKNVAQLFGELMIILCALIGAIIGSVVAPGVGTVVGMALGLVLGFYISDLEGDEGSIDSTLKKLAQTIMITFVAAAFGLTLAAVGIVSGGVGLVLSLAIGLALHFFVSSIDDSAVTNATKKQDVKVVGKTVSYRKVPALASGAVIPPNREFMAVLGDQKQGTNIETPLSTMVQAFEQALSRNNYNGQSEAYLMLDKEVLGKVVYKLNKSESKRIGVNLTERG